jgi:NADP-dependent 3-hydroxy acid dehydrogenase YdfG
MFKADLLRGKTALITGGGTGIGRATAMRFAETGAAVMLCGRRREPLEETRDSIVLLGGEAAIYPMNIREPEAAAAAIAAVAARWGRLDMLINNAGGQIGATR